MTRPSWKIPFSIHWGYLCKRSYGSPASRCGSFLLINALRWTVFHKRYRMKPATPREIREGSPHRHAQSQYINAQSITADVNDIFHHGDLQRDLGISHGAEQRRTGIVQGKEREGQCRDHHIDHSIMKYVRFNFTEKQGNDAVTEHHDQNRNTDRNAYG